MFIKNALVHRLTLWNPPPLAELAERLAAHRFVPCGPTQTQSVGWVAPRGERDAALIETVGGQWILRLCTETKGVPAGVVKGLVEERLDALERETGRRPKGKPVRELKEQFVHELLPRAFPKRALSWVWIDPAAMRLVIDCASAKRADAIVTQLMELLGAGLALEPLQTALSPATAMAGWLLEQEAPYGFSIDRECELRQPDGEKPSVRYARHLLEIDEVSAHIRQGKVPTQLALTWRSRVSFALTETMALKRVKLLDVVLEDSAAGTQDGGFEADTALVTGELRQLLPELLAALGGEPAAEAQPLAA